MSDTTIDELNFALVGTGSISEGALAPAILASPRARLRGVVSRNIDRAETFANQFHAPNTEKALCYDNLTECLTDHELDAVVIATPDGLHAAQTIEAAEASIHVLVEKPMATSVEDARAMIDACEDNDVRLGVAYHARWNRGHRQLARRVHAGEFGEIRHARAQWTFQAPDAGNWRAHDELAHWWSLSATGTHCVDWIDWMLSPVCGEIVDISSVVSRGVLGSQHDETASVSMKFSSGATAQFTCSALFAAPGRCEIYGTNDFAVGVGTLGRGGGGEIVTSSGPLDFEEVDPYVGEINDFADAIMAGRDPEVSGEAGLRNIEILLKAYV